MIITKEVAVYNMLRDALYLLLVQFLTGVKDSIYGVLIIYSIDLKIQRQLEERQRRLNDAVEERQVRRVGGRPSCKPAVILFYFICCFWRL